MFILPEAEKVDGSMETPNNLLLGDRKYVMPFKHLFKHPQKD